MYKYSTFWDWSNMKIVIDTSCVMAVLLNENSRSAIIDSTVGTQLISPEIIYAELGNALSAMFKKKRLVLDQANEVMIKFQKLPISLKPINVSRALELSYEHQIYAYDAYFLELCLRQNLPLLTLDESMIGIARKLHISIIKL